MERRPAERPWHSHARRRQQAGRPIPGRQVQRQRAPFARQRCWRQRYCIQSKGQQMKNLKTAISLLALAAMTAQASAADLCNPASAAALKTAAIQQELMVAGFTSGAADTYNPFVLA